MSWRQGLRCVAIAWIAAVPAAESRADVTRDGSLGAGVIGPGLDADGQFADYVIDETHGALSGSNLFQSFSQFDVGSGEIASFTTTTPLALDNVIARVTGGDGSSIDGMLRSTIDGAALFLLDPRGVFFGQDAELDVKGSFHASSADLLRFESGPDFDASDATPAPLLSSAAPAAFGFTQPDPGFVTVSRSRDLGVPAGETLSLVGGFDSAFPGLGGVQIISTAGRGENLLAPGATVQIAAARPGVDVPLDLVDLEMDALAPDALGNVVFQNSAQVDVSSPFSGAPTTPPAGEVVIRAGQFLMTSGAFVQARNGADAAPVGPIDIRTTGSLVVEGGSQISTWSQFGGASGEVWLRAGDELVIADGGQVNSFATGDGAGGGLHLRAPVVRVNGGELKSRSFSGGPAGAIDVVGDDVVELADGGRIISEAFAGGDGAPIDVTTPLLTVSNASNAATGTFISTNTLSTNPDGGSGGTLNVGVDTLELLDGGQLFARTSGTGDAGPLTVNAAQLVHLDGEDGAGRPSGITSRALQPATGEGGRIEIHTAVAEVLGGAQIASDTFGEGAAGDLVLDATQSVLVEGGPNGVSIISAASFAQAGSPENLGPGGDIEITTDQFTLRSGGQTSASASGTGDAGTIGIDAANVLVTGSADPTGFNPSGVFSQSLTFGVAGGGDGGNIEIRASEDITVSDRGRISALTDGTGDAGTMLLEARNLTVSDGALLAATDAGGAGGSILVDVADTATFSQGATATVRTDGSGPGGSIDIDAGKRVRIDSGAVLSAETSNGPGGSIEIDAGSAVQMGRASITASATGPGDAGDIDANGGTLFEMKGSSITTTATASSGGNIKISADELVELDSSRIETQVLAGDPGEAAGDVNIDPKFVVLNHSQIIANAAGENVDAGNISITTDFFFLSGDSLLQATAETGIDGEIEVVSPVSDLTGSVAALPATFLDASALLERDCAARTARAGSFAVQARHPTPPPPDARLDAAGAASADPSAGTPPACEETTP